MEPTYIEMSVHPVSDVEYDFHMVITPNREPSSKVLVDKTFRGRFGVPLELSTAAGEFNVKGSLTILRYRARA